jgi:hypothetical protein
MEHSLGPTHCVTVQHTLELLVAQFGLLMTSEEVARVLKFPTGPALRAALRRKRIELTPVDMPGRKQHVFATEDVASCMDRWKRKGAASENHAGAPGKEAAM